MVEVDVSVCWLAHATLRLARVVGGALRLGAVSAVRFHQQAFALSACTGARVTTLCAEERVPASERASVYDLDNSSS